MMGEEALGETNGQQRMMGEEALGERPWALTAPVLSSFAREVAPRRLRVAPIDAEAMVRAGRLQELGGPVDRGAAVWVTKSQLRDLGFFHREWVWVWAVPGGEGQGGHLAIILATEFCWGQPDKYRHLLSNLSAPPGTYPHSTLPPGTYPHSTLPPGTYPHSTLPPGTYPHSTLPYGFPTGTHTALISAPLLFNLAPRTRPLSEILIQRFCSDTLEGGSSALVGPPLAKQLCVQIVASPSYDSDAPYRQALFHHFLTARVIQRGDILCLSSLSHGEFLQNNPRRAGRCPDLYFKVLGIDGRPGEEQRPAYLAHSNHMILFQEGSTLSYVPSFPSRDGHVFWSSLFPAGLSHAVDEICRILQPYLEVSREVLPTGGRVLFSGSPSSGKKTVVKAACSRLNLHLYQIECARLCREGSAGNVARLKASLSRVPEFAPCLVLLSQVELLGRERDGSREDGRVISAFRSLLLGGETQARDLPVLVVATTSSPKEIPLDIQTCFLNEVSLEPPTEEQRLSLLAALTAPLPLGRDVSITKLARTTAGFVLGDFCSLVSRAGLSASNRIRSSRPVTEEEGEGPLAAGVALGAQDFQEALSALQDSQAEAVGAPKVPCVQWRDVGGLHDVKRQLLDTVQLPLEHPEVLSMGLRRSGVLLYGPPGTGKTLLAKAVATECAMTFLSVKGPELINMYVGQSEENVRKVFSRARSAAPCIIFFDELDSLAPSRGRSGDSGGVMDRVVSQLLAELDGLNSSSDVFVIGATNRPDLLDSALLRPGRFDKLLYVGVNEERDSQLRVLAAITRKFSLDPSVDLSAVIERCPRAVTGADLYSLCADAMMGAVKERVQQLEDGHQQQTPEPLVKMEHFLQAANRLQPSVCVKTAT
uniref:Peroxisomal ATPase PEX6 n=1 Tax=Xenopus tropicalis TaxID=8364 RepID=A0A803JR67_XENTR